MRSDARKRAEAFLVQCGPCDGGLPMGCACNPDDPRPVFADLLDRLNSAERKVAAVEALAERWSALHGPYPNGFCTTLPLLRSVDELRNALKDS